MKWHVTAADAQTGEDRVFLIDAETAPEAEASARRAGYLVSQVMPVPQTVDPLAQLAAVAAPAPTEVGYRPPPRAHPPDLITPAPEYWGLRFGSMAFLVFAGLFYLAGLLGVIAGVAMLVSSLGYQSGWGLLGAFGQFLLSLWPIAAGTVFHAASSGCLALRDIARNSFAR